MNETKIKKVCCECREELTQKEIEYNKEKGLSGYCTIHNKVGVI